MIDYTEPKKKRVNFSISPKAVELLKTNIPEQRRSMFVDFLITKYCQHEAGYFNNLVFSKKTAEILARNNREKAEKETCDDSHLPELISELCGHLVKLKSEYDDQSKQIQQMKFELEGLING